MDDIYETIEEYNPNKERKILIFFDDMIADMPSNKKPNPATNCVFCQREKTKHFSCFYRTILFVYTEKY